MYSSCETWIPFKIGDPLPHKTLIAGTEKFSDCDQEFYIGRTLSESKGWLMVTYFLPMKRALVYNDKGKSKKITSFEILTGTNHIWMTTTNYEVPESAVTFGMNDKGQSLYICRMGLVDHLCQHSSSPCSLNPSSKKFEQVEDAGISDPGCQILVRIPFDLSDAASFSESFLNPNSKNDVLLLMTAIFKKHEPNYTQEINFAKYHHAEPTIEDAFSNIQLQDGKDEDLCSICLELEKNALFLPCSHLSCCIECAKTEKNRTGHCPICRKGVKNVIKVFKS